MPEKLLFASGSFAQSFHRVFTQDASDLDKVLRIHFAWPSAADACAAPLAGLAFASCQLFSGPEFIDAFRFC